MRALTLGVIAITSTLMFACTTETTTELGSRGSADPNSAAGSKPDDPNAVSGGAGSWHPKLALSTPGTASAIASLTSKLKNQNPGATPQFRSGGGAAGSCGLSTGDATCDTCLDTSCCAENTACSSNADCMALITCGDACTDDACISACMSAHPTGADLMNTFSTCIENSCTTACGGGPSSPPPPGGPGGPPPSTSTCGFGSGDPTCDSCLDTNCCGDANACFGDPDCTALIDCSRACTDQTCETACETAHPSGTTKLNALSTCAGTCDSACANAGAPPPPPGPGSPPGPASCGLTSGDVTCDTCLDTSCCGETTTCINDADCVAVINCYDTCSDSTCASACDTAHPGGSSKLNAVMTCAQSSCTSACGF